MDEFRIQTAPGKGTRIEAVKWFDDYQRALRPIDDIRKLFFSASEASMIEELQAQNSELVRRSYAIDIVAGGQSESVRRRSGRSDRPRYTEAAGTDEAADSESHSMRPMRV